MLVEIKSKLDETVLFSMDTGSFKMALEAAVLQGVDLANANCSEQDLRGAILHNGKFNEATFRNSDLWSADLSGCQLKNSDLNACLVNAGFGKADLTGAKYDAADTRGAGAEGAAISPGKEINAKK